MNAVTVTAPAKINLTLDVTGRRADGYHLLESLMQTVDCRDALTARRIPAGIVLETAAGTAPVDCPPEKNTVTRAAAAFLRETGTDGGVAFTLEKHIPTQAGMGGGSADAAAALWALDRLFETHLPADRLAEIGASVGADVPFCVIGGTAFVTGIGEILRPVSPLPPCHIVIAQPPEGVSTAAAYAALDTGTPARRPDHPAALAALERGDLAGVCRECVNVFEDAVALPGVDGIRRQMAAFHPLAARMTGSGSAVFAVFPATDAGKAAADRCAAALKAQYPVTFVCKPCGGPAVVD